MFQRSELGRGSAAAVLMLLGSLVVVLVPYGLYRALAAAEAGPGMTLDPRHRSMPH